MFAKLQSWFTKKSPNHMRQVRYSFDGCTITADGPLAQRTSVKVEDIREIGVATTDTGPFVEDVFWLINRDAEGLHIPTGLTGLQRVDGLFRFAGGFRLAALHRGDVLHRLPLLFMLETAT